jgi:hypothetical protein
LETSSRKAPPSVRSKRTAKEYPSTPLAIPSQIRGWNQSTSFTGFPEQSPVRSRVVKGSPPESHARRTPEKPKKPAKLPGFQNSFMDATPVRSVQSRVKKEATISINPVHIPDTSPPTSPIPFPPQFNDIQMNDSKDFAQSMGSELLDVERAGDEGVFDRTEPFNWNAEVFTLLHSLFAVTKFTS